MNEFTWTELDARAVDTARVLAADAVEKVGTGIPACHFVGADCASSIPEGDGR